MKQVKEFRIRELDLELINPNTENYMKNGSHGWKGVIIGKPGSGKSYLVKSIMWAKRKLIPSCLIMSATEDSNGFYSKHCPETLIHNDYNEELLERLITRQKLAKKHLPNPYCMLIIDDCTHDSKVLRKVTQQNIWKNGRHYALLYLLVLQYALDIPPSIRTNIDGVFILRESVLKNRRMLFENFAGGVIQDFQLFCQLLDEICQDYTALYIRNNTTSNNIEDLVFYYKAPNDIPEDFKFPASKDCWKHHHHRFNENYEYDF